jgi:ribonuclease PH
MANQEESSRVVCPRILPFHFVLGVVTGTEMSTMADWIAAVHPPWKVRPSVGWISAIHSMTSFAGTSRTENEAAGSLPERISEP